MSEEYGSMLEWAADVLLAAEAECKAGREDTPFSLAAWQLRDCLSELLHDREELHAMRREFGRAVYQKAVDRDTVTTVPHYWMKPGDSVKVFSGSPIVIVPNDKLSLLDQPDEVFGEQKEKIEIVHSLARRRVRGAA